MAKSKTTLGKGDNLPPRGKAQKTLILEAIRKQSILAIKCSKNATLIEQREATEIAFWQHVAKRAVNPADPASPTLIRAIIDKGWSNVKPSMNPIEFTFDSSASDTTKAKAILDAIAMGEIPPDVGSMLLTSLKDISIIEANTELKERIEAIEKSLGLANG